MVTGVTRHCLTSACCLRPRWRCCACRGASSSSSTPPSAPCRCMWRPCWRRPACMRPPCRPSGWWPSWTTSASSRSRWRSWRPCRWTRPSTPASSPSSSSPPVSCERRRSESSTVWHSSGLLLFSSSGLDKIIFLSRKATTALYLFVFFGCCFYCRTFCFVIQT